MTRGCFTDTQQSTRYTDLGPIYIFNKDTTTTSPSPSLEPEPSPTDLGGKKLLRESQVFPYTLLGFTLQGIEKEKGVKTKDLDYKVSDKTVISTLQG
jgi:hypothetical protein